MADLNQKRSIRSWFNRIPAKYQHDYQARQLYENYKQLEYSVIVEENPYVQPLGGLSPEQLNKAQLVFDDKAKHDWHYLPATMYPRAGILLNELYSEQKQLLFDLLQTSLSETGYSKTKQIISLENVLAEISGETHYWIRLAVCLLRPALLLEHGVE